MCLSMNTLPFYFLWSTQDKVEIVLTHNFKIMKIINHILKYL